MDAQQLVFDHRIADRVTVDGRCLVVRQVGLRLKRPLDADFRAVRSDRVQEGGPRLRRDRFPSGPQLVGGRATPGAGPRQVIGQLPRRFGVVASRPGPPATELGHGLLITGQLAVGPLHAAVVARATLGREQWDHLLQRTSVTT